MTDLNNPVTVVKIAQKVAKLSEEPKTVDKSIEGVNCE